MSRVRQWHADWWVTCAGPCNDQKWVDGNTAQKRYRWLRQTLGWRYVEGQGWTCPDCLEKR